MRKAWKKAVSVLLTLVLIFGVLPAMNVSAEGEGGQGSSNSVEITLDNGTYDENYKKHMVQSNILQIILMAVKVLYGMIYRS